MNLHDPLGKHRAPANIGLEKMAQRWKIGELKYGPPPRNKNPRENLHRLQFLEGVDHGSVALLEGQFAKFFFFFWGGGIPSRSC